MAKALAVLGTMSSVGKSLLTALLAHHFTKKGLKVFPFKAQNMSLNAFATEEGEMAHAQVFQAWAARRKPSVRMNPLLLKPMGNLSSEIIFLGKSEGILPSEEFRRFKAHYKERVFRVFEEVLSENDLVLIEGAGSLAELNLLQDDFVNYEIVKRYRIPFILVGDIDRGGVFAQIWGTYELVPELKDLSLGFVINKFRGAEELFAEGVKILEEKTGKPCLGLLPFLPESIFEEDSASLGLPRGKFSSSGLKIAVVYYPHISNYLDFDPFKAEEDVEIILTDDPYELNRAHVIFLPGSKNTLASLTYLKKQGLFEELRSLAQRKIIFGLCGGFQLLGRIIRDEGVENRGEEEALALLPHETLFYPEKIASSRTTLLDFPFYSGEIRGFEIRYGRSFWGEKEVISLARGNVFGTYLHGVFYDDDFRNSFLNYARKTFGFAPRQRTSFSSYLEEKLRGFAEVPAFRKFFERVE
ncbi:MAG: cobyric acid synthase, partial [Thermodesulfobacteria bacterium]|nr:cobyric acid synthase [Thermodesulfobacteriota bacterium]